MEKKRSIGYSLKTLNNIIERRVANIKILVDTDRLTGMHSWIIGYLYENRKKDIFQRDLEEQFTIRRSTATGILQLMERNGLIQREAVDFDARLKKVILTPKAIAIHEEIMAEFKKIEEELSNGISEEELDVFFSVIEKIRKNME
jgi:DNA-binding MarR family transcriptional regulator